MAAVLSVYLTEALHLERFDFGFKDPKDPRPDDSKAECRHIYSTWLVRWLTDSCAVFTWLGNGVLSILRRVYLQVSAEGRALSSRCDGSSSYVIFCLLLATRTCPARVVRPSINYDFTKTPDFVRISSRRCSAVRIRLQTSTNSSRMPFPENRTMFKEMS